MANAILIFGWNDSQQCIVLSIFLSNLAQISGGKVYDFIVPNNAQKLKV